VVEYQSVGIDVTAHKELEQELQESRDRFRLVMLFHACRHVAARAKAGAPGASLIGIGSLAGTQGAARNSVYAATKGAVPAVMNSIATEYARFGVRANTIVPGWIATDRTAERRADPAYSERVLPRIPARRWGEPEDFAGIAVYLASDASAYHTGDTIVIDGGYQVF